MGASTSRESNLEEQQVYDPIPPPRVSQGVTLRMINLVVQAPVAMPRTEPPKDIPLNRVTLPVMIDKGTICAQLVHALAVSITAIYHADKEARIEINVVDECGRDLATKKIYDAGSNIKNELTRRELKCTLPLSSRQACDAILFIKISISDGKSQVRSTVSLTGGIQKVEELCYSDAQYASGLDLLTLYVTQPHESRSEALTGDDSHDTRESICSICLSNRANVGFLPCRHVCVCSGCWSITLSSSENHCPICRQLVTGRISLK